MRIQNARWKVRGRLAVVVLLAAFAGRVAAASFYSGNDIGSKGTGEYNIEKLLKIDVSQLCVLGEGVAKADGFLIKGSGNAGTWCYKGTEYTISAITVKAGNGYVVVPVNSTTGIWSTKLLGNKDLSHITFWGTCPPKHVPEASTLFAAFATLGYGWHLRRKSR
jgi:hypothetical protein